MTLIVVGKTDVQISDYVEFLKQAIAHNNHNIIHYQDAIAIERNAIERSQNEIDELKRELYRRAIEAALKGEPK